MTTAQRSKRGSVWLQSRGQDLQSHLDRAGRVTTITTDLSGRVSKKEFTDTGDTANYAYNAAGQLVSQDLNGDAVGQSFVRSGAAFRISVPAVYFGPAFDPKGEKPDWERWEDYIQLRVDEFGAFMFDAYLSNMRKIAAVAPGACSHVLNSLDKVVSTIEGIELSGRVSPLRHGKIGLVELK